jgi:Recombination endonuclease VII
MGGKQDPAKKKAYAQKWRASWTPAQRAKQADACRKWREKNPARAKAFVREATLVQRYGITQADYEALLAQQSGVCAVCKEAPKGRALDVDHCHETGQVRGLLCRSCNIALGMLRDCSSRITAMRDYINKWTWLK